MIEPSNHALQPTPVGVGSSANAGHVVVPAWLSLGRSATENSMSVPPPMLDGARVLWWTCSGEIPFGELPGAEGDDRLIYGFAVCRYDSGELYRFTCNKHWEVVQDMDHEDEDEAKADIPMQYDATRVDWRRYIAEPGVAPDCGGNN